MEEKDIYEDNDESPDTNDTVELDVTQYEQLKQAYIRVKSDNKTLESDNRVLAEELERRYSQKKNLIISFVVIALLIATSALLGIWGLKEHNELQNVLSRSAVADTSQRQSVQKLSDLERGLNSAEGEKMSLEKDLERVKKDLERIKTDNSKQIQVLEDANTKLREENKKLADKESGSTEALDSMTLELETLRRRVQELQNSNNEAEQYIAELEDYATSLENQ